MKIAGKSFVKFGFEMQCVGTTNTYANTYKAYNISDDETLFCILFYTTISVLECRTEIIV